MKANILKTVVAVGMGLVLFSYIYTSKGYEIFTTTFFLLVFGILIASMIIYPICYWLFIALSKTYTIYKGMNYSGFRFKPYFFLKPFSIKLTVHDSFKVQTEGIQKIFGIGYLNHSKNSFRYGITYDGKKDVYHLWKYFYTNNKPMYLYHGEVKPNQPILLEFNKNTVPNWKKIKTFGKFLFPYFEQDGGKNNKGKGAPHNMKMTITVIR